MKRRILTVAAALSTVVGVTLVGVTGVSHHSLASPAEAKSITIGVSFDVVEPIRNAELAAINVEAKKKGVTIDFQQANNDPQTQASQIQDMIQAKHVNAIIAIAQNQTQIVSSIRLANNNNVPFIAMDRAPAAGGKVTLTITGNPHADGKTAGKALIAAAKKPIQALNLLGALTDNNAIQRRKGFEDAFKRVKHAKIVAEVPTDWSPAEALSATENALQKNPKINAIFSPSDILLEAVQNGLTQQHKSFKVGKKGAVTIVTIDGAQNGCAAVKARTDAGDVSTPIGQFGKRAVDAAIKAVNGHKVSPSVVTLPGKLLTKANFAKVKKVVWGCARYVGRRG